MNNLVQRVISGAVLGLVFITGLLLHPATAAFLLLLLACLGMREWEQLLKAKTLHAKSTTGYGLIFLGFMAFGLVYFKVESLSTVVVVYAAFAAFWLAVSSAYQLLYQGMTISNWAMGIGGAIYVVMPFLLLVFLLLMPNSGAVASGWRILSFFLLLWTSDTGQYFSGRAFGKHKLFESVSPNKTWEGFIGGLLLTMLVGGLLHLLLPHLFPQLVSAIFLGALLCVAGTVGDLTESAIKRQLAVKDSGALIPGHGGILDRFDSTLSGASLYTVYQLLADKLPW